MFSVPRTARTALTLVMLLALLDKSRVHSFRRQKLGLAFLAGHLLGGNKHTFISISPQQEAKPYPILWPVPVSKNDHKRVEHIVKTTHVHHYHGIHDDLW
ncbi:hypothetical protein BIW11_13781 [Tropilaelaps mercedesae]|uniref:Secreted protein n=1 Tax=Tropilaelaps mercedesae TaxID=418985 RepID=A0A1V9X0Q4_9ACAR|nr:hypothetical protein BIW11_13781 [Tropilaelaps mercedesae]